MRPAWLARSAWSLVSLMMPCLLHAQFNSSIEVVVTDRSGEVIPGALVTVVNVATNAKRQITTSGEGFYRVVDLGLGTYNVSVESRGFKTAEERDVAVAASQTVRVNVTVNLRLLQQTASQTTLETTSSTFPSEGQFLARFKINFAET